MARKLCADTLDARAEALEEAANHLLLKWTDDTLSYQQGLVVSDQLLKQAKALYEKSIERT